MKQKLMTLVLFIIILSACSREKAGLAVETFAETDGFVFVEGGSFINSTSNLFNTIVTVQDFYIGKYEVTQKEWVDIMGSNPSHFQGDNLPVEMVSWYEAVEYCNKRSEKEGLQSYYNIDKDNKDPNNLNPEDDVLWTVTVNWGANGYRLPTEIEWEYASGGGQKSMSREYSGSADPDEVAWYFRNSGDEYLTDFWQWPMIEENNSRTQPVGQKKENELGIYDMSGNVREWCWDWFGDKTETESGMYRVWRGGGWVGDEEACKSYYRGRLDANWKYNDIGLRVIRGR